MKLYGIPNCNTVKKARDWLDVNHIVYTFHDFKKLGISQPILENWLNQFPHEKIINRAGLTWRGLDAPQKIALLIIRLLSHSCNPKPLSSNGLF
jgi:arsenate reductase (glutaredoxin)